MCGIVTHSTLYSLYTIELESCTVHVHDDTILQKIHKKGQYKVHLHVKSVDTILVRALNHMYMYMYMYLYVLHFMYICINFAIQVSPMYTSALETLSSIDRSVIMEVMGYRAPSMGLLPVFEGLCLLFDRPPTWDDCQQLMLSRHFYQSMRFFDKDSIPQRKLNKLEKLLADQKKISLPRMSEVLHTCTCACTYMQSCTSLYTMTLQSMEP